MVNANSDQKEGTAGSKLVDRFYRTLYDSLLNPHKASFLDEYFGLLFKSMKVDQEVGRVLAFVKRVLQISYHNDANFAAGSLLVVSEVIQARPDIKLHVYGVDALIGNSKD